MLSMTGFGRGEANIDGREIVVELKSVNHRFLDISLHSSKIFAFAEDQIKKDISKYFARGHIDVFISYKNSRADSKVVSVDEGLLKQYVSVFNTMKSYGIKVKVSQDTVISLPEVLSVTTASEDREVLLQLVSEALKIACEQLLQMRINEGKCLKEDLSSKLSVIQASKITIGQLSSKVASELADKLRSRLQEALGDIPVDEQRLAQELVIAADRLAIDEELVRLQAHIDNMLSYMNADEPLGRKLEFMLQEINREVNTIGSKAMNVEIQSQVITMKGEIEKLREQVQNVE